MKLVHINKVGTSGDLYVVRDFHAAVDPGYGRPGTGSGRPDNTLPGIPGMPDNALPEPPVVMPGWTLVALRKPDGTWSYATVAPSDPPPRPVPPEIPAGGLPDNGLPPQPAPKAY